MLSDAFESVRKRSETFLKRPKVLNRKPETFLKRSEAFGIIFRMSVRKCSIGGVRKHKSNLTSIEKVRMLRACGTSSETFEHDLAKCRYFLSRAGNTSDVLYVNVKYYILYRSTIEDIELTKLQGQHDIINACLNGLNESQSKIPKTGKYAFSDRVGVPAVVFLPENSKNLSDKLITRLSCSEDFKSLQEVVDFLKGKGVELSETTLNIIIAPLHGILGQTTLGQNVTVVDGGTVGTQLQPGKRMEFGQGMTLVHELGHVFGLTHTWNSSKATVILSDIPIQRYPNHTFRFSSNEYTGEADAMMCNRMRDCQRAQGVKDMDIKGKAGPYSWLSTLECDSEMFEMGCNFMDYASDENMAMFTKTQAQIIRGCVLDSKYMNTNTAVETVSSTRRKIQRLTKSSTWWNTWEAVGFGTASSIALLFGIFGMTFNRGWIWVLCSFGVLLTLGIIFLVLVLTRKVEKTKTVRAGAVLTNGYIRLTQVTETSVSVSWSPPNGSVYSVYSVFVNGTKHGDTNDLTYKIESLDAASTYNIAVKTGDVTEFMISTVTLPIEPQDFTVSYATYDSVHLKWKAGVGTARILYNVYQNDVNVGNTEDTEMTINGLIGGSSYNFGVSAQTKSGESTHANVPASTVPNEVQNLRQSDCDSRAVWCEFSAPVGYYVAFKVYVNDVFVKDLDSQQITFSLNNLLPSTDYSVRVTSVSQTLVESSGIKITASTFRIVSAPLDGRISSITASGCTLVVTPPDENTAYSYHVQASAYFSPEPELVKFKYADLDYSPSQEIFIPFVPNGSYTALVTFMVYSSLVNAFNTVVLSDTYLGLGQDTALSGFIIE